MGLYLLEGELDAVPSHEKGCVLKKEHIMPHSPSNQAGFALDRVAGNDLMATPGRCLLELMTDVTSKVLHEKTGQLLDRARQGERFRILRGGQIEAFLVPATDTIDPEWPQIMAEVWRTQKECGPKRPNPILKERKSRNYASGVR